MHKNLRTILQQLKKCRIRGLTTKVIKGKKHIKILHEYRGRVAKWFASSTPSDVNAVKAMARDLEAALLRIGVRAERIPDFSVGLTTFDMSYASYSNRELNKFWRFLRELAETGELPEHEVPEAVSKKRFAA